ncbi:oligosaccharide flippase family protein [Haloprofundus salinisoli]|uniref:oligosaccharide flippase family protein n=1 Tax=Haloprofundus salinisoli TaxID=2876193 RepID=UPI001CCFED3B|nr:oligosaccharide flippase family protein [Haloprofundus salinisoli]
MTVGAEVSKRFLANVFGTVAGFAGTVFFTRELGAPGLGVYAIFTSFQMAAATVVTFGLFSALTKRVSEGENQAKHFTSGILIVLVGTALSALAFAAAAPLVNGVLDADAALLVPLGILSWSLMRVAGAFLEGKGEVALAGFIENGRYVVIVGLQTALLLAGYGVYALLWGLVLGQFATFLVAYLGYARVVPAFPSRELVGDFFSFSKYTYVQSLGSQLFKQADYIVLGQLFGTGAAGLYKISFTLTEAAMLFSSALSDVSFPEFSRLQANDRGERIRELLAKSVTYAGLFAIPAIGGGLVVGNDLLSVVYGVAPGTVSLGALGAVGVGNLLIAVLALANLSNGYRSVLESYFLGTNRPRISALSSVVLIVTYAVLVLPLAELGGTIGLGLVTTLSFGGSCLLLWRTLDYRPTRAVAKDVGTQLAATVVMMAVVATLYAVLDGVSGALTLCLLLGVGGVTYFASLLVVNGRLRNDAWWVVRDLTGEIR